MPLRSLALTALAVAALAGCGERAKNQIAFAEIVDEADDLLDRRRGVGATPIGNLPTSGDATYEGYFGAQVFTNRSDDDADERLLGRMTMNVDFANTMVSGRVTDIVAQSGAAVTGSLRVPETDFGLNLFATTFRGDLALDRQGYPRGEGAAFDVGVAGAFTGRDGDGINMIGNGDWGGRFVEQFSAVERD